MYLYSVRNMYSLIFVCFVCKMDSLNNKEREKTKGKFYSLRNKSEQKTIGFFITKFFNQKTNYV